MGPARLFQTARLFVLAVAVLLSGAARAANATIDFLYINAGEGSASGGHAAIRFDHEVFHFQHVDPGLLRAYRDDFAAFRFTYGFRENRTIEAHRVEVEDGVFQNLRDAFSRRYLIQNQQFAGLKNLNEDLRLIADLKQSQRTQPGQEPPPTLDLEGLGYFVKHYRPGAGLAAATPAVANRSPQLAELKQAAIAVYGADFLRRKRLEAWQRLQALKPDVADGSADLSEERFEAADISFARRYKNLLLNLAALDVLETETVPSTETMPTADPPGLRLDAGAVDKLSVFRRTLFTDLIGLLRSARYDWGYPLLIGMARLHALDLSIQTRRLVVLERCLDGDRDEKPQTVGREDLPALTRYVEQALNTATRRLSEPAFLDEQNYGEIELAASRSIKIQTLAPGDETIILPALGSTPALAAQAEITPLPISIEELEAHALRITAQIDAYIGKLQSLYNYRLFDRNCVTEIFRVIDAALARQLAQQTGGDEPAPESMARLSQQWLGGYVDNQPWHIIPFAAFDAVGDRYRLISSYRLPPYREREIAARNAGESVIPADLAESNILTSSIYRWHGEDAAFLFFTQDAPWPRPIFGVANLAVGLGQTLYGLLSLPWDAAENLRAGIKGMAISIPELFFFNIRKGTFPQLLPGVTVVDNE